MESETQNVSHVHDAFMIDILCNIAFKGNRHKVKFSWKKSLKMSLNNNKKMACKIFLKLISSFRNEPVLVFHYKSILYNYLAGNIVEPVINTSDVNTLYLSPQSTNLCN